MSIFVHFISKYDSFAITGIDDITSGSYSGSLYNAGIYCDSQAYVALNLGAVSSASKVADKPIVQIISYMKAIEFAQKCVVHDSIECLAEIKGYNVHIWG